MHTLLKVKQCIKQSVKTKFIAEILKSLSRYLTTFKIHF